MAKETITRLVDDLDGGVAHETVKFGLDGHLYEIDLSTKNAKKLRSELATFVEHGTRVSARAATPTRSGRHSGSAPGHPDQNRAIREWAQSKGYQIARRGRISQNIVTPSTRTPDANNQAQTQPTRPVPSNDGTGPPASVEPLTRSQVRRRSHLPS